jgi:hypothetical protein
MPVDNHIAMSPRQATPFDSVESAHEYLRLLAEAVLDAKRDVANDVASGADSQFPRRAEALRLVFFKLEKLEEYLKNSSRVLNDLRTLRRLLLDERPEQAASESE